MATAIDTGEVRFCLQDEGTGIPLLLLHGFPATRHLWSALIQPLAKAGFRVIAPDLIGYGESEAPPGVRIDMASQANWMWALLEHLHLARITLIAHDVGTAVAQLMAVSAPQRVRGVALLNGVFSDEWGMQSISSIQAWNETEARRLFPVLQRRLGKNVALREMLSAYEGEKGGLRLIRASRDLDPRQTVGMAERLRATGVPASLLWGESDEFLSIDAVGQRLADSLSVPLVRLPGGHFTPLECPVEVADALGRFLAVLGP